MNICKWNDPPILEAGFYQLVCSNCGLPYKSTTPKANRQCIKQPLDTISKVDDFTPREVDVTDMQYMSKAKERITSVTVIPLPEEPVIASAGNFNIEPMPVEQPVTTEPPSLLQKAKNFTKAIVKHAADGGARCTDEQIQNRAEICFGCQYFKRNEGEASGMCSHMGCGCNITKKQEFLNKLAWASESCPVGKWGPELNPDGV